MDQLEVEDLKVEDLKEMEDLEDLNNKSDFYIKAVSIRLFLF